MSLPRSPGNLENIKIPLDQRQKAPPRSSQTWSLSGMPAALRTPLGESRNAEKALLLKQKATLGTLAGGRAAQGGANDGRAQ